MINYEKVNMMSDSDIIKWADRKDREYYDLLIDINNGYHTGGLVIGPPGVSKSYEGKWVLTKAGVKHVNLLASEYEKDDDGNWQTIRLEVGNGPLVRKSDYSVWALYADLYGNRSKAMGGVLDEPGIIIIDDNDEIMKDLVGLSLMMASTERDVVKEVDLTRANFNTELRKMNVPSKFESDAKLVILTNFKMVEEIQNYKNKVKGYQGKKPAYITRWEPLCSRMEYFDMELDHPRLLRVYVENKLKKHKILQNDELLIQRYGRGTTDKEMNKVIDWLRENQPKLKLGLDLRLAQDIASNIIRFPQDWKEKCKKYVNTF
jgi:hypothetical protein